MARRGRKRKIGKREPNGRIQRERGIDPNEVAGQLKHRTADVCWLDLRRAIPLEKRHDAKAEHPLGRYCLVGAISNLQYDAGMMFAGEVARYRRVLDVRKDRQSIAGFGQPCAPTPRELDDDQAIEIRRDYMLAFEAIGSRTGQAIIKHVVILERELQPDLFHYLHGALEQLVSHYDLTSRGKSAKRPKYTMRNRVETP